MTTYIPQPKRDRNGRVQGDFYPLQREELMALHKAKIIHNAAYVHLALRSENPFCDRPIPVNFKQFSKRWKMKESSLYEAIGRLKEEKLIETSDGKVNILWTTYSQQEQDSENPESILEVQNENSGNPESILGIQSQSWKSRIDSGSSEKRASEPLPSEDLPVLQTLQTNTDFLQTINTKHIQTDPPLSPKGETHNIPQQIEIFDTEQPETPRSGGQAFSETVNQSTNQQDEEKPNQDSIVPVQAQPSAHVEQKINTKTKFNQQQADWLIQQYNENKPSTWPKCCKCTNNLYRSFSKLYTEFGSELASVWLDALQYPVAVNNWWQSGNNRSIQTLLRSDRVAEWSDAVQARTNGGKIMSDLELSMAEDFERTMAAIADL